MRVIMLSTRSVKKVLKSSISVFLVFFLLIHKFSVTVKASSSSYNITGVHQEGFCLDDTECKTREICNTATNQCQCDEFSYLHEYAHNKYFCMHCPIEGESCPNNCCYGDDVFCVRDVCTRCKRKENGGLLCPNGGQLIFATASQIALSAALIIGIAALATLLFRMCSKRSLTDRPRSHRGLLGEDISRFSSERASLSSIQIRILQRLRDRPPRYETRHNFNQRSQSQEPGIAPPTYDNSSVPSTDTELPPPYIIAIGTPAFDNSGYMPDSPAPETRSASDDSENPPRTQQNSHQTCSETSKSGLLSEEDKAIHM